MPDEERVRKKRRKLDSIITKLHQATPLGSDSLGEEENLSDAVKENVHIDKTNESLPRSSRRKLHKAVKQKQTSRSSDEEGHLQEEPQGAEDDVAETQVTENGMEVDDEQEVPCNGEDNTDKEVVSDCVPVVKQEPVDNYENSLEGLHQMLGYSISEEVGKQNEQGSPKKKRLLSESSDAGGYELPRKVECTACGRNVNPAHGTICRHPCLNVLVCKKCNQYYNSGPFTRDEFGIDEQCRWCGDGGSLLCCDKCDKAFCKPCIKRNLGKSSLKEIVNAPEGTEWLCFCCNPTPLSKLVKACNRIMNILQTRKAQKTIFKMKKGSSMTDTPNQKERRSRLSSLTENMGLSSDGALSPSESPTKKSMSNVDEDDSDEDDSGTKQRTKKARTKTRGTKHSKQNGCTKEDVLVVDDDSDSDNVVQITKGSKGRTSKGQGDRKTKRKLEVRAEPDDDRDKKGSKISKAKKTRTRKDSSNDSNSDEKKQNSKAQSKATSKGRSKRGVSAQSSDEEGDHSDSDSDFVSMVKGTGSHPKKDSKKQKKEKGKKEAASDSEEKEEEEEEGDEDEEDKEEEEESESENDKKTKRSRKSSVSQKQTRKRPRKMTSSEDESESSDDQSESDVPVTRNKKKQARKQSKKKKKMASESDGDDNKEEIGRKNRGKSRQKAKKSSSESDDKKKHSKKKKKAESDSDGDDEEEEIGRKKRRDKSRRRARTSSSETDADKKKGKKKGKGKGKGKQKGRKKHFIQDSEESEEGDEEEVSPSKRKGRKKIRKLMEDEKLAEETRKARRLEEERRKRLLERTRNNEDDMPGESAKVSKLVLESDSSTKEPIVEVTEDLLQHLKPHQCKGIQFMYDCIIESVKSWKKDEPGGGCILAHCMGLGKTLQVVALVHTLMSHKDVNMQRVLVVAPLNTVLNWQVEFDKWLSVDDRLEVLILQEVGGDNWRRADMLKHWLRYGGVVLMGYSMYRNLSQCYRVKSKNQKKIFQEALVDPGPDLVICDEGHILRNDGSAISKALNGIKTRRRIVLTGTPLQNNLIEYHCMVSFVKPSLLGTRKEFTNTFVNPIENGQCADSTAMDVQLMKQRCHVLHKMLEGCVQRRDYSVLIPFLPRKHEYVIKVRLSALQRKLYQHFLNTFVFAEGFGSKQGVSLFSDYQALMRIWTHPWCLKLDALRRPEKFVDTDSMDDFVVHSDEEEEEEEVESESEKSTTSEEEEVQSSSDSEDEGRRGRQRGGRRDKKDSSSDERDSVYDSQDDSEVEVLPQSSRSRAAAAKKASPPTVNIDGEDITVVAINDRASTSRGKSRGEEPHSSKGSSKKETSDKERKAMSRNNGRQSRNGSNNNSNSEPETFGSTRSGTSFKDEVVEKEWYDEFLTEADEFNVQLSGKLVLLMEILADAEAVGDKVLVFSQSLVTLDLIEKVLGGGDIGGDRENWCRGCDYFRMDGSTSAAMRQRWADIFNDEDNKNARLFLISTKAGGLGINLVAANRVIVFDVSWNPSHDVQSIFRVYRFGQSKAVYVYRLIAQGTMEEKIYDRQVTKLSMSSRVVDEQQIERHFTAADLRELYTFNPDILEEDKEKEAGNETEAGKEDGAGKEKETMKENQAEQEAEAGKENEGGKEAAGVADSGVADESDAGKESEAAKESEASKEVPERPTLPLPKDAVLADLINRLHPKWIVKYHEHDSLLQNIQSEELTEEEMKAAWEAYEAEKSGRLAPAYTRAPDPLQGHAQTQQHVAERIRLNSEMLQQIQQIRQLQEIQQRQDLEERMRRARQQRDQLYQQHRDVLLQQHQRQQDELRRQNELRFIQHMTQQPPGQPLQLGQNTINVQTALPRVAAPHHPPPPFLRFQIPSSVRIGAPSAGATPSPGTPPIVNLTLGPRPIGALSSSNPQLSRPPQNTAPK